MKLEEPFFHRPCLSVARDLVGKILVHRVGTEELRLRISETEAYCGQEDTACHAHKGRTPRTETLYMAAGTIYIYLCYGMHWLMNIITGEVEQPQGVLIRACLEADGPGKLTKRLKINGCLNRQSIIGNREIWIEDDGKRYDILLDKRVGIRYASQEDQDRLWRFKLGPEQH